MITDIFPIPVYHGVVSNRHLIYDNITEDMLMHDLETNIENWQCNCKTSWRNIEKLSWKEIFYEAIEPNIVEYLTSLSPLQEFSIVHKGAWANFYDEHDHQEAHNHFGRESLFSYSFNFKIPEDQENRSAFNIRDMDNDAVKYSYSNFKIFENCKSYNLGAGTIIIFPSWVWHSVTPNRTKDRRITISGNIDINVD